MAQERMYNLALLNTEQDIVHKMDFTDVINLLTAAKTRKTVLNCSFSKDLQFWISFSSISGPKIILLSVQFEKNTLFPIFATFAFSKKNVIHEYKAKVSSSLGLEFLQCARAHVVLIRHSLGRFPQVSNSHPIDLSFSLQ